MTFPMQIVITLTLVLIKMSTSNVFEKLDPSFHIVHEAYTMAKTIFEQGRNNYVVLKNRSRRTINTFLDLVQIMNEEMSRELRTAVLKFYKISYFRDFSNYMIAMEEIVDIVEHCLQDPVEKLDQVRAQFHEVIENFQDVRNFQTIESCHVELPDEVAVAHCLLHQAVLLNQTMQESLVKIVEIKTRQHAQDMNYTIHDVRNCLRGFVPNFFNQLLSDSYTEQCVLLKVVTASINDMVKETWGSNGTLFPDKWRPLITILKKKASVPKSTLKESLLSTLKAVNLTSSEIVQSLYKFI